METSAALLLLLAGMTARADEIRIVASPGFSGVLGELGPRFERATGHTLAVRYGLIAEQRRQIEAGDFDLAIAPSAVLDQEIKLGKVVADTRAEVARVVLGVGVRAGAAKPDLASSDAFKRALLDTRSVAYVTNEPTGQHIAQAFDRLGIGDAMKAKTRSQDSVARAWQAVTAGEADLGFGFASNVATAPGIALAGFFPRELQYSVVLVAGIGGSARQTDAAKALIQYLLAPDAATVMKSKGLEPATP